MGPRPALSNSRSPSPGPSRGKGNNKKKPRPCRISSESSSPSPSRGKGTKTGKQTAKRTGSPAGPKKVKKKVTVRPPPSRSSSGSLTPSRAPTVPRSPGPNRGPARGNSGTATPSRRTTVPPSPGPNRGPSRSNSGTATPSRAPTVPRSPGPNRGPSRSNSGSSNPSRTPTVPRSPGPVRGRGNDTPPVRRPLEPPAPNRGRGTGRGGSGNSGRGGSGNSGSGRGGSGGSGRGGGRGGSGRGGGRGGSGRGGGRGSSSSSDSGGRGRGGRGRGGQGGRGRRGGQGGNGERGRRAGPYDVRATGGVKRPHKWHPGTVSLRETKEFEEIPANYPMKKPKMEKMYYPYVSAKEQVAHLPQRKSSRALGLEDKSRNENQIVDIDPAMESKALQALSNAKKSSQHQVTLLRPLINKVLLRGDLKITPAILASFLVDINDGDSVFYWYQNNVEAFISFLTSLCNRVRGFESEVSKRFGTIAEASDIANVGFVAAAYFAGLKSGLILPEASVWSPQTLWSNVQGQFFNEVLQIMASKMDSRSLIKFMRDSKILDMITNGKGFVEQLCDYFNCNKGVRVSKLIQQGIIDLLVDQIANLLTDCPKIEEEELIRKTENCNVSQEALVKMIWDAIIKNVSSCHLSVKVHTFLNQTKTLAERNELKGILQQNVQGFFQTMQIPEKYSFLVDELSRFVDGCIDWGLIKVSDIQTWKGNHHVGAISDNKCHAFLATANF